MIPEIAWDLIPDDDPSNGPSWATNVADSAALGKRERRAYLWSMRLLDQVYGRGVSTAISGIGNWPSEAPLILDITAGFIPFNSITVGGTDAWRRLRLQNHRSSSPVVHDGKSAISYSFGVVIGVAATGREARDPDISQFISLDGDFPVVAEIRANEWQAPPHPLGVTSTCFAVPRASKRFFGPIWSCGVVIARHVLSGLGYSTGINVPMANGNSYPVADIDTDATTIDAAILDVGSKPVGLNPLLLATAIAPGTNIDVITKSSVLGGQVLRINDHPHYFGNMMAHRIFVDQIGRPGDSGSLVQRTAPHCDAAGLYMGSAGLVPPEGIVQSLRQVVNYFDIDLLN